ncbi:hypothetical protein C6990_09585 [Nitrosopumilus sp. b3]|uniref:hypothetical protein n=1 Tax=Nitrosopumilus sp. b3 TaxID=2109909 RepID=UPI0015F4715C|nr:hypothetical protein [Nitrosopumilus sp. b3]KAF6246368.1 hypothetical protein C6990_09585 [Nitrosopumilus sp. b3]
MKTELKIISVMAVLVSATLFLVYQNPNEIPKSLSFKKQTNEIISINEKSKKYKLDGNMQQFNASRILMGEKFKELSLDLLGIKISKVTLLEGQYPFMTVQQRAEKFDYVPSSICAIEQNIPLQLQKISQTKNFQIFSKKYASHTLELDIFDERNDISNIHYGLIATNEKNQLASTYFHLDTCTNEITDKQPYHLNCFDKNTDYRFASFNTDDVLSSYSNGHFCNIELDSWRQSLYEYSLTLRDQRHQLRQESMIESIDNESHWKFISEMNKLGELGNLVGQIIHYNYDEQSLHEQIEQYEKQYGSIPEELSELMEKRK